MPFSPEISANADETPGAAGTGKPAPATAGSIPIEAVPPGTVPAEAENRGRAPKVITPERLAAEISRLDVLLVVVALVLTFFLASFAARNSDFWMHLATGRLIANGQYRFGADPFSYTTPDTPWTWINRAWLSDLGLYLAAEAAGGPESPRAGVVLVAAKALLITAMVAVLLLIRTKERSLWIPVVCTTLAVYAMSRWLFLQPRCLSFLFLAITALLLFRPSATDKGVAASTGSSPSQRWPRRWLVLPFLFALWVNVDDWFFLGPATVALVLIGESVRNWLTATGRGVELYHPSHGKALALVLVAGLAACLLNPYHVHAFLQLPPALAALFSADAVRMNAEFRPLLNSPVRAEYLTNPLLGWGYLVVAGLGLLSFYVNSGRCLGGRALVWVAFWLLSLRLEAFIPFFAVLSGAIAALNLQDGIDQRLGRQELLTSRGWRNWAVLGRLGTLLIGLALGALAWAGWLHAAPDDYNRTHRVAWVIDVDESYRQAALKLQQLHEQKILQEGNHGFNLNPDFANYCAWFCPQEKNFVDTRVQLFPNVLTAYAEAREGFYGSSRNTTNWQALFRDPQYRVNHVVVNGIDSNATIAAIRLWEQKAEWTLLYTNGRSNVFGWTDPEKPAESEVFRRHALPVYLMAFDRHVPAEERAPEKAPPLPRRRTAWTEFLEGPVRRPLQADRAGIYFAFAQTNPRWPEFFRVTRLVGGWADLSRPVWTLGGFSPIRRDVFTMSLANNGQLVPPGPLLLAIRSGRQAIAASPDDADPYAMLANLYQTLWGGLENRWVEGRALFLQQLRQIQVITALRNALVLKPESPILHEQLFRIYDQMHVEPLIRGIPGSRSRTLFLDLELEHLRAWVKYTKAAGKTAKAPNETDDQLAKRLDQMDKLVQEVDKEQQRRLNEWETRMKDRPPLQKALGAIDFGLVGHAIEILAGLDKEQLGAEGPDLLIRLYLRTGQAALIRESELVPRDAWGKVFLNAALGDYATAEEYLVEWDRQAANMDTAILLGGVRENTFRAHPSLLGDLVQRVGGPMDRGDRVVLAGLLALERGDTEKAAALFRKGLELSRSSRQPDADTTKQSAARPPRFPTEPLASQYLEWLSAAGHPRAESTGGAARNAEENSTAAPSEKGD
jgi:hypothetical protein